MFLFGVLIVALMFAGVMLFVSGGLDRLERRLQARSVKEGTAGNVTTFTRHVDPKA